MHAYAFTDLACRDLHLELATGHYRSRQAGFLYVFVVLTLLGLASSVLLLRRSRTRDSVAISDWWNPHERSYAC